MLPVLPCNTANDDTTADSGSAAGAGDSVSDGVGELVLAVFSGVEVGLRLGVRLRGLDETAVSSSTAGWSGDLRAGGLDRAELFPWVLLLLLLLSSRCCFPCGSLLVLSPYL